MSVRFGLILLVRFGDSGIWPWCAKKALIGAVGTFVVAWRQPMSKGLFYSNASGSGRVSGGRSRSQAATVTPTSSQFIYFVSQLALQAFSVLLWCIGSRISVYWIRLQFIFSLALVYWISVGTWISVYWIRLQFI